MQPTYSPFAAALRAGRQSQGLSYDEAGAVIRQNQQVFVALEFDWIKPTQQEYKTLNEYFGALPLPQGFRQEENERIKNNG